jgi:hypothetical protein
MAEYALKTVKKIVLEKPVIEIRMHKQTLWCIYFSSCTTCSVGGLNSERGCLFLSRAASDLQEIRDSKGRNGAYLYECCQFYKAWHIKSDHLDGEPKR